MSRVMLLLLLVLTSCNSAQHADHRTDIEATSLLGGSLLRPQIDETKRATLESNLASAKATFDANPHDEDAAIWYGRRLAYLGLFRDAIEVYSRALIDHPQSHRLLRHRGHRYITIRRFDLALADLQRAAELCRSVPDSIEPDGDPNDKNTPRGTDHSAIFYHLGLVHYLRGEYEPAARAFAMQEGFATFNDDMLVSRTYWGYLSLRRLGRDADAARLLEPIREGLDVRENKSYYKLCMLFKGLARESDLVPTDTDTLEAGIGYGVAMNRLFSGERAAAHDLLAKIVTRTAWISFGYVAAEADLARAQPYRRGE